MVEPGVRLESSEGNPVVKVLRLSGRIDTQTVGSITPSVLQAVEQNTAGLIVDLRDVSFVSSAGLRLFVMAFKNAKTSNTKMAMVRLQPEIYKMFKIAALDDLLKVYGDEAQALAEVWK